MRIHTNTLTRDDLMAAARVAGVSFYRLEEKGSRSAARAFDFILEGSGRRGGQFGGNYSSATWDEWGIALAELFRRDPQARVPGVYEDGEHFRWVTGARFDELAPAQQHRQHRWNYTGECVTGAYHVRDCKGCTAHMRTLSSHYTWAMINSLV